MHILLVSATALEIEPLIEHLRSHWIASDHLVFTLHDCTVTVLISGVGMHKMAYALGRQLALSTPDLCVNAGIAGAFPGKAVIGDVVHIISETIADLGAEDLSGDILVLDILGLNEDAFDSEMINAAGSQHAAFKTARGITVNTTHGSEASINKVIALHDPDIETMEGGAFFYSCLKAAVPFMQIRSISNIVEPRNRENWNIPLAVTNLNKELIGILDLFSPRK